MARTKRPSEAESKSGTTVSRMAILAGRMSAGKSRPLRLTKVTKRLRSRLDFVLRNMSANQTLRADDDKNTDPDFSCQPPPLETRCDRLGKQDVFFRFCSGLRVVDQQAASQLEIQKQFSKFCSSTLRTSAPYETDFGCWYGKIIIFKDQESSRVRSQFKGGGTDAETVNTAQIRMRTILKNGSRVNGEYLLYKPVCAIFGGLTWKAGSKTFESDMVNHAVVVIVQEGKDGLEILQKDPQNIRDARIRPMVVDFAKYFGVNLIKLLPCNPDDTSREFPLLECYKFIGQVVDGTYHNDRPLVRTYNVSTARFEMDTFEDEVALK